MDWHLARIVAVHRIVANEDKLRLRVADNPLDLIRRAGVVDADRGSTSHLGGSVCAVPFTSIVGVDREVLTSFVAQRN